MTVRPKTHVALPASLAVLALLLPAPQARGADGPGEPFPTMRSVRGRMPCGSCRPPSEIGPRASIVERSEPGERLVLSGTVYSEDGRSPVEGVVLFVYQTDASGHYNARNDPHDPRIRGWVRTGPGGRYELATIRPGAYPSATEPAHIHLHAYGPGRPEWFLPEFLFADDPLLPASRRALPKELGRLSPVVTLRRDPDGTLRGTRDIRLEAARPRD